MLQLALFLMALGNLLCSFAKTPIQLYCFRGISGIGGGGINNIAMIIVRVSTPWQIHETMVDDESLSGV